MQCRIILSSVRKYRAWIELVLCNKYAECRDNTEMEDSAQLAPGFPDTREGRQ